MANEKKIPGTVDAWENGELGTSAKHARRASPETMQGIDEALELQPISIRLPKNTIDTYKRLARMYGVGYQPLMRDAVCRWAESELKLLLIGASENQRQHDKHAEVNPPPAPMKKAA
jgi:hypothetical protein